MNVVRYCMTHPEGYYYPETPKLVVHALYIGPDAEDRVIVSVYHDGKFYYHDVKVLKNRYGKYIRVRNHKAGYDIRQYTHPVCKGIHDYRRAEGRVIDGLY